MPFRINSACFFLTYPQCPITPDVIGHHIESLGATTYVLAVQELHEDGAWHVHAIAIFSEKKNIRREDYFDFEGYHPNIQSTRDRIATRNYILKSAPVDEALYESGAFDDGKRGGSSRAAWKRAIEATTYDEVMAAVAEASPRDFLLSHDRVEAFAQKKSTLLVDYVPNPDDVFSLPQHITDWVMQEYTKRVSYRCLTRTAHSARFARAAPRRGRPTASPRSPRKSINCEYLLTQCYFLGQAKKFTSRRSITLREDAVGSFLGLTRILERNDGPSHLQQGRNVHHLR